MKIYINNFNINLLDIISRTCKNYLVNTDTYIKLYTNEGVYRIEDKKIYMLDICDKDIIIMDNYYEDYQLIVDPSFYHKHLVTSIYGETHLSFRTVKQYYKIHNASKLQMIIKYISDNEKMIPNDIYFELKDDDNFDNIFIKQEIIEFLSLLN